MSEVYSEILQLHLSGKRNYEIVEVLSFKGVSKSLVSRTLKRCRETGDSKRKHGSGTKRSVRTPQLIKVIRERIRKNQGRSSRKLARDFGVSCGTMHSLLHQDLGIRAYKKQKIHGLTQAQTEKDTCEVKYSSSGTHLMKLYSPMKNFFFYSSLTTLKMIEFGRFRFTTFQTTS